MERKGNAEQAGESERLQQYYALCLFRVFLVLRITIRRNTIRAYQGDSAMKRAQAFFLFLFLGIIPLSAAWPVRAQNGHSGNGMTAPTPLCSSTQAAVKTARDARSSIPESKVCATPLTRNWA
ncbi:MAG: hypothetical protein LBD68_02190 [Zoogloeaceae bacterium]|jgi:hypothetical protein|nr:hypothetical protein [Zoogloeaceae bacterium]